MARGDDKYLLKKDRGPDRALVRDVVDTRRNLSTLFIPIAFLVTLFICSPGTTRTVAALVGSQQLILGALNAIFYLMVAVLFVDGYLIARRVRQVMARKLPNQRANFGLYIYGSQRAILPRRFRQPKPRLGAHDSP